MKITQIYRTTKDKLGNPLINRNGKPWERVAIKTDVYGDRYISGFSAEWNRNWQRGYDIGEAVKVTESETLDKNGQPYLNFSQVTKEDVMEDAIKNIELRLSRLEKVFNPANTQNPTNGSMPVIDVDEENIRPEDLPF